MFIKAIRRNSNQAAKVSPFCGFFVAADPLLSIKTQLITTYALTSRPDQACVYSLKGEL